jgi:cell division protein FtsI (penicillin-binding protein 3)
MSARARRRSIEAQPAVDYWVRVRVYIAAGVLTALFCGIAYKAYAVQVDSAAHYRDLARRQHLRTVEVPAARGAIYDATGAELAVTAEVDSVFANPREVVDVTSTAEAVAEILDLDVRTVEAKLSSSRYFVWLERHITVAEADAVRGAALPGVSLTREPRRYYPFQTLAGTVLGFAGIDGRGLDGMELSMDELLLGKHARLTALRDARGRTMMPADSDEHAASAGASIALTLDRFVQFASERALAEAIENNEAEAGTVVVMDVATGAVLAMASWPTYDPNDPDGGNRRRGARNRAVTDAFEMGSIMKVFTIAAAIDAGAVSPDDWIDVEHGRYKIGRKVIRDTHRDWQLTVSGVLKRSSNVGAVKIVRMLGNDALYAALVRFGFGAPTGIELPGEREGVIHSPSTWGELGLATISFGYGMTATPIQVAQAVAAVGNGGILNEPRLVKEVRDADGKVVYRHQPRGRRIMKAETAAAMLPMMASVFEKGKNGGTARSVEIDGFRAGGKTGTSHKLDPTTRKYSKDLYLSSFVGLAPIDDPKIAVVVLIDEPHGDEHYGGKVAGPVFARIVSETLRHMAVPGDPKPESDEDRRAAADDDADADAETEIERSPELAIGDVIRGELPEALTDDGQIRVPSFVGLGAGRALDTAREYGLGVEIEGSGRVVEQFPLPGPADRAVVVRLVMSARAP